MKELIFHKDNGVFMTRKAIVRGDDVVKIWIRGNMIELDFRETTKLINWLDDWKYEQRAKCHDCHHERDMCQQHDI